MHIENLTALLPPSDQGWLAQIQDHFAARPAGLSLYPLRFAVTRIEGGAAQLETAALRYEPGEPFTESLAEIEILAPQIWPVRNGPFTVVQIIPTGIGCEIGGFAGDACPATNLLAAAADFVVTHPNAVNASELNEMDDNVLYVEGKLLDDFLLGHIGLEPSRGNRVGTVVDATARENLDFVVNTLDAASASGGLECGAWIGTDKEIGTNVGWSKSGCATGAIDQPEAFLDAAHRLLGARCNAIGVLSVIHGVTREAFLSHQQNGAPNPSGGVEAIITHLISKIFRVPSAHAPLPYYSEHKQGCPIDPRSAAEFISFPHYFSVLKGLSRAPRPVPLRPGHPSSETTLRAADVAAVIMPSSALGGLPALAAELNGIPIIAVAENRTVLAMDRQAMKLTNVIEAKSYAEAAGFILALRHGISLRSLRRPFEPAKEILRSSASGKRLRLVAEPTPQPAETRWRNRRFS
jgi:hypothetical protein